TTRVDRSGSARRRSSSDAYPVAVRGWLPASRKPRSDWQAAPRVGRWRSGAVRDVLLRLAIGPVRHGAFVRRAKSAVGRALGDAGLIAKALNGVGFGLSANGQPARAIAAHNEEAVVARSINDGDSLRFALNAIGKAHRGLNDLADAEMYYEQ